MSFEPSYLSYLCEVVNSYPVSRAEAFGFHRASYSEVEMLWTGPVEQNITAGLPMIYSALSQIAFIYIARSKAGSANPINSGQKAVFMSSSSVAFLKYYYIQISCF